MAKEKAKPRKKQKKNTNILVRVSDKEKEMIDQVARAHGMSRSEYMRAMALLNTDQRLDV